MKNYLVVLASGVGARFGADCPKQFMSICGKMIIEHTLRAVDNGLFNKIILVVSAPYIAMMQERVMRGGYRAEILVVEGGQTRRASCEKGLAAIEDNEGKVVIHNGVQPFVSRDVFVACLEALNHYPAVTAGSPCVYTVLETNEANVIERLPIRSRCFRDLGPECFILSTIRAALKGEPEDASFINLTAVVRKQGLGEVFVVEDRDSQNIKITYPEDIVFAERILRRRELVVNEDPFNFAPLWEALLRIYCEFRTVCERHGLRHFVIAGTLLGAVRHKGFIPWDDDLDLAMPREDYEKFLALPKSELPECLQIINRRVVASFPELYSKLVDTRQSEVRRVEKAIGHELAMGLFIDIFPLDGYADTWFGAACIRTREIVWHILRSDKDYHESRKKLSLKQKLISCLAMLLKPFQKCVLDDKEFANLSERHLRARPFDDRRRSGTGGYGIGEFQMVFPKNTFGKGVEMPFEGVTVNAPEKWAEFLRINYGDYMQMPPEEKRVPTHTRDKAADWRFGVSER